MIKEYVMDWVLADEMNTLLNLRSHDGWDVHSFQFLDGTYTVLFERNGNKREQRYRLEEIHYIDCLRRELDDAISLLTSDEFKPLSEEEKSKWLERRSHIRDLYKLIEIQVEVGKM